MTAVDPGGWCGGTPEIRSWRGDLVQSTRDTRHSIQFRCAGTGSVASTLTRRAIDPVHLNLMGLDPEQCCV